MAKNINPVCKYCNYDFDEKHFEEHVANCTVRLKNSPITELTYPEVIRAGRMAEFKEYLEKKKNEIK